MTAAELKNKLLKEINEIDDPELLSSLDLFLELNRNTDEPYILNEVQKKLLEQSEREIERGEFKSHEEVMKEIDEWMKRK